ncbi:MAG TPA: PDR/VanB family oxidoreductase [Caulobacteraceae bacterium]|jgi:ferredoxin-NADP reductase|nr:PDR/VanB family oxidoreductase [Caulobacteraceae bacterium]
MIVPSQIPYRVREVEKLSPTLKRFYLEAADGGALPPSSAGAHVVLTIPGVHRTWKNAYSISSTPGERESYSIIVRRVLNSRGGSVQMHEGVTAGDVINGAVPHNLFALSRAGRKHVLIAGGIGITPLLSHAAALHGGEAPFELHQFSSKAEIPVFERLLGVYAGHAQVHGPGGEAEAVEAILTHQPLGAHVYVCGPPLLIELVVRTAEQLGWPTAAIHHESFGDHSAGAPFTAMLAKSKIEIAVGPDQSLLEAIEAVGVQAPYLCRGGACGQCMTRVIAGEPDHRDDVLTPEERAAGELIMTCVSRAKTPRLVLDL